MSVPLYQALRDFAGPVATVIAAIAAVGVTFYFNRRQTSIAEAQHQVSAAQKDIAFDKLKHDLFDRRYAIYSAAKSLGQRRLRLAWQKPAQFFDEECVKHELQIKEAPFFFPKDVQAYLTKLIEASDEVEVAAVARNDIDATDTRWRGLTDDLNRVVRALRGILKELPSAFERDLRFDEMVRSRGAADEAPVSSPRDASADSPTSSA